MENATEGVRFSPDPRSNRIPRIGSFLCASGAGLLATSVLLQATVSYLLETESFHQWVSTTELADAAEGILIALGVLFLLLGWYLDRSAIARSLGRFGGPASSSQAVAGLILAGVGGVLAMAWGAYLAFVGLAEYYNVPLNLWRWTGLTFDLLFGVGILLVAVGWLLHHLDMLRRISSAQAQMSGSPPDGIRI